MLDLINEASTLGTLLEETRGVVGVVLGTIDGELRTVVGSFVDGAATATSAAALTSELSKVGSLLGLGELGVVSLKAPTGARVFAHQFWAVLAVELDPKRPLGELEMKLQTLDWAPREEAEGPAVNRQPTVPVGTRSGSVPIPASTATNPSLLPPTATGSRSGPLPNRTTGQIRPAAGSSDVPTRPPQYGSDLPARPSLATASGVRPKPPTPPPNARIRPPTPTAVTRLPPPEDPTRSSTPTTPTNLGPRRSASATNLPGRVKSVGSVGASPVFTGDLEEFCLPDLLEFLRNSHRSGLLMCTAYAGVGTVQLSRGMIISASSPNALDLREHLLTSADLDPERRRALAALPLESFGDTANDGVLLARNLVSADEMERARVARIYSAFREMMAWTVGRFSFDPGVAVVANPALALSAQTILMDIYQEQDEQGR